MPHSHVSAPRTAAGERTTALARIVDVVLDPGAAFAEVRSRPTWGVAFLALVALRFGSVLAFYNPETTPAKLVSGVLFQLVTLFPLVIATSTLLWIVALSWRSRLTYASAWCVATHVTLAHSLLTVAIASVAGALLPESVDVQLRHPPFTNVGFLVDATNNPLLHTLAAELDLRSGYEAALAWLGVRSGSNASPWRSAGTVLTCVAIIATLSMMSAR